MNDRKPYIPKDIEPKWQKIWADTGVYKADFDSVKPKFYSFAMFNYPSGAGIHVGHARNYTIPDVVSRAKRQQGFESYQPVGWDSFGLPAENFAIKTGISPQESIKKAIEKYREQYNAMGWSVDWSKEIDTTDPEYYKWTQWIFLKLFENNLAYQKESPQWWCDKCKTVLADEQVVAGKCWRHDSTDDAFVTKKNLKQWFFRITDFADELLEATDRLDWTPSVKASQKSWIGRSEGALVKFAIADESEHPADSLKFTPTLTDMILEGNKRTTIRLEAKKLMIGDTVELITRHDKNTTEPFADARISSIKSVALKDVPLDLEGHEKFIDRDAILGDYKNYYGPSVTLDTIFTIYEFTDVRRKFIDVYTTRPDTLYGATFLVVAPEHPMLATITSVEQKDVVEEYVAKAAAKTDLERLESKEKTGVFTGAYAVNPMNSEKLPIWVADYVMLGYGTGAIMAVPAHDQRDYEFAQKFQLPIKQVISGGDTLGAAFVGDGVLVNSDDLDNLSVAEAKIEIIKQLTKKGTGKPQVQYKMRDWLISRQRYWGAPIPVVHCEKCGVVAVPEKDLPVVLPEIQNYEPTGGAMSVLAGVDEWVNVECPECGGNAKRETDTMDGYVCSSWYFLRYLSPHDDTQAWSKAMTDKWMPADFYNGGDHATAHLLYARFFARFFHKLGLLSDPEPFKKMLYNGKVRAQDGSAFSKTLGNGVDPLEVIEQGYGADALRLYEMFAAPLEQNVLWDPQGIPGALRFLNRVWTIVQDYISTEEEVGDGVAEIALLKLANKTTKKVTTDIEDYKFNTAIAALMEAVNGYYKIKEKHGVSHSAAWQYTIEGLVQLLAPFAPHITEELWSQIGHSGSIHVSNWPRYDAALIKDDMITIVVQVNGRLRGEFLAAAGANKDELETEARKLAVDKKLFAGEPNKVIVVPGKLVNLVV